MKPLQGKRICLSHPYNIAYDVRLIKSVRALQEAGAEVSIMVRRYESLRDTLYHDLCEVIEVDTIAHPAPVRSSQHRIWLLKILWNVLVFEPLYRLTVAKDDPNIIAGFAEEMIKRDFDIVHFTDYVSAPEAVRMKTLSDRAVIYETYEYSPTVIKSVHASDDEIQYYCEAEIKAMDRSDAVIVVGEEIKNKYLTQTRNSNLHVVYNTPPSKPCDVQPPHHPMRFYFQSIIRPGYGLEMLVDAFSLVRGDWELAIQGPNAYPKYKKELERYVLSKGLEDRISFPDPVSSYEVVQEANKHDVGVLLIPSIQGGAVHENARYALPNKFFVYANAGLAMVLGNYIAMKNLIGETESVAWVDELSISDVADNIQELVDNPLRVKGMKRASFEWAQDYTVDRSMQQITDTYASVMRD